MEAHARQILVALLVSGLLMVPLSFAPWLSFESSVQSGESVTVELSGTHTSRLRDLENIGRNDVKEEDGWCSCRVDVGDGYFVAGLGALIAVLAGASLRFGHARIVPLGALLSALGALAITGFDALGDWTALVYTNASLLEEVEGSPTIWMIALLIVEVLAAILSAMLWSILRESDEDYDYFDEEPPEELGEWA